MYTGYNVKCSLFLSGIHGSSIFATQFLEIPKYVLNVMKILPVGIELFQADRRTDGQREIQADMTNLIIVFYNFSNALKNTVSSAQTAFRPSHYHQQTDAS